MPGFDRTGPQGFGPMTGGGRGFCNPRGALAGSRWTGRSRSLAYPRRNDWWPWEKPVPSQPEELDSLRAEFRLLREELARLEEDIGKLAGKAEEQK